MIVIDLRSDTVTRPSPEMRAAIAAAEVGDDVLGDDPTVVRLQERAAALLGMQAALFVPSGTMANQLAIRCACQPGDEIICDDSTHSFHYETGGPAALSGVGIRTLGGQRGIFTAAQVEAAVRPGDSHFPSSRMVIVEDTNNRGGGSVWPLERIREICEVCTRRDLHLHIDGARLMHAATALGCAPADIASQADSVSTCFSKGLGAPVGSVLAGSTKLIQRAHRFRKMFGGGMRQVGILAAAGLHALEHHVERLADDHRNARRLAEGLAALDVEVREAPETNMVYFRMDDVAGFLRETRARDLWINPMAAGTFRAVTHIDVDADDVEDALGRTAEALAALRR